MKSIKNEFWLKSLILILTIYTFLMLSYIFDELYEYKFRETKSYVDNGFTFGEGIILQKLAYCWSTIPNVFFHLKC